MKRIRFFTKKNKLKTTLGGVTLLFLLTLTGLVWRPLQARYNLENFPWPQGTTLRAETFMIYPPLFSQIAPIRDYTIGDVETSAKAVLVYDTKRQKILWQKQAFKSRPIASLTKLMTALVALEEIPKDKLLKVSLKATETPGQAGGFEPGEHFFAIDLLKALLIQSSNDAAVALAEYLGYEQFIKLMNEKASALNLQNSHFANPTGLDEDNNFSSAFDLAKLSEKLLEYPVFWEILGTKEVIIQSQEGLPHKLRNTNQLLGNPDMIAAKTGFTQEAGGCLLALLKMPNQEHLILVILGAKDRFQEAQTLIQWLKKAYIWR